MHFSVKEVTRHLHRGEFVKADELCRQAITSAPGDGDAWHLRGVAAMGMKAHERAVQYILRARFHKPGDCKMHLNLALALAALQRFEEATAAFEEAAKLDPSNFEAHFLRASYLFTRKDYAEAAKAVEKAIDLQPDSAAALERKAAIVQRMGRHDDAFAAAQRAVTISDARPTSHRILGDIYARRLDYSAAERHYLAAIGHNPDEIEALGNFGLLLSRMGRHEDAVARYQQADYLVKNDPQTAYGLSMALLTLGRFTEGWPLYAMRDPARAHPRSDGLPRLTRLPARSERVLLNADQGPGEQIMFASLLPNLIATGAVLTVVCNERLLPLFERSFPKVRFIGRDQVLEGVYDVHQGLPDMARWLRQSYSDFPVHRGYLTPDPARVQMLRARYAAVGKSNFLVGLSWRTIQEAKVSAQKTIPLDRWGPILAMPGVTVVNLQYGECEDELRAAEEAFGIRILRDLSINPALDLDAFAAQTAALDLVITTSNTTAHVAGALNVPTWTFVPIGYGGLWHWFLERNDSPWYPSVRLFRQVERGDWQPALDAASAALAEAVETRRFLL